ncbi:TRAP transporter small permease [Pokkaliibacter sp. MBI-7]|uniref:TRAP transporter small permease n=1 Tax=Pokkaliibacter sp. MBI-7 TaxID=3040600 RepID=UPI00244B9938|nr:TRAP transporter small permease [Pokkaliibacter sp. MBI-7]MDH2431992.1 TRAP transporter small permease [Pokkaliibacter sp. MBI-7]
MMNGISALFDGLDFIIANIIKPVVVVLSCIIAFLMVYGIFARSIIGHPVFGLEEIIMMAAVWLYMLGAVLASRDRSHLAADFVQVVCKNQKVVKFMTLVATAISLFMAVMFSIWGYDLFIWGYEKGQTTIVFHIPQYLAQGSLFVASLLLIFYLLRDCVNDFASFKNALKD